MDKVQFKQGRAMWEGLSGGIMPNLYTVTDRNFMYQPMRNGSAYGDPAGYPMFIVEERMGDCCSRDCCCRCCCNPQHPSISELYIASDPIPGDDMCCGACHTSDYVEKVAPTLARNCASLVCHLFVRQDEMRFHQGGGLD